MRDLPIRKSEKILSIGDNFEEKRDKNEKKRELNLVRETFTWLMACLQKCSQKNTPKLSESVS
ncbi:hypothetical protein GCM10007216_16210 [Thalassobacillus devorans]|uniref:Uncharacterized protein n=1 Tax=Thalassobacillus devorans TaxID=279813 RepID=A0ABQ1NWH3_9BACI|nr:hypothetical protein GCM10007216_16210 [Thalassobacillus devorans]